MLPIVPEAELAVAGRTPQRLCDRFDTICRIVSVAFLFGAQAIAVTAAAAKPAAPEATASPIVAPQPIPAIRPQGKPAVGNGVEVPSVAPRSIFTAPLAAGTDQVAAQQRRRIAMSKVRSWGYQLAGLDISNAARAPYDLLVVDATSGIGDGKPFTQNDVERLKRADDGPRRRVVSYLSIGEAEDYRPDYFSSEYLEEDAPDWLMHENAQWKGNRLIRFCKEGWQQTILGDDQGRNVYNSIEPSPLYRIIELGFDGVYLDRVDVYAEVGKDCPDAERRMVAFVKRLAAHARKRNPDFLVILQNAEELLQHPDMIKSIDAVAKEDLFYGVDHTEKANAPSLVGETIGHLKRARAKGLPVFFVDYVADARKISDARRRGMAEGFIPYFAPRDLARLWLPDRDY